MLYLNVHIRLAGMYVKKSLKFNTFISLRLKTYLNFWFSTSTLVILFKVIVFFFKKKNTITLNPHNKLISKTAKLRRNSLVGKAIGSKPIERGFDSFFLCAPFFNFGLWVSYCVFYFFFLKKKKTP